MPDIMTSVINDFKEELNMKMPKSTPPIWLDIMRICSFFAGLLMIGFIFAYLVIMSLIALFSTEPFVLLLTPYHSWFVLVTLAVCVLCWFLESKAAVDYD